MYALRSIGCGYAAAKQFCGLMNMPPPPRPTPYSRYNRALLNAVEHCCLMLRHLSKVCKKCKLHEDDKNTPQNAAWRQDHQDTCKANYRRSAPAMDPEGASRMFKR